MRKKSKYACTNIFCIDFSKDSSSNCQIFCPRGAKTCQERKIFDKRVSEEPLLGEATENIKKAEGMVYII